MIAEVRQGIREHVVTNMEAKGIACAESRGVMANVVIGYIESSYEGGFAEFCADPKYAAKVVVNTLGRYTCAYESKVIQTLSGLASSIGEMQGVVQEIEGHE